MAGALKLTSISAPGFLGLNTQDSGVTLESGYATVANNCVIDKYGRLGARKGWATVTTNNGTLADDEDIEAIYEFKDITGTITYLSAGGGKLFTGTETLTEHNVKEADETTNASVLFTTNRWKFVSLPEGTGPTASSYAFAAQIGAPMLVWRRASHVGSYIFQRVGTDYGAKPSGVTVFDPDCILAAFGRIWTANLTSTKSTIYYSKLLDGADFSSSGSGLVDISSVVGNNDEIVALAQHNNYLIVFCKNNIVVYQGANSPTTMTLADVVTGVGCIARDSVQYTGTDLIFLSKTGVRSFNRTIQENSMPLRELSLNIRDDLVGYLAVETLSNIKSAYYERDAFYLLTFPGSRTMIYFDLRSMLPNGAARATLWNNDSGETYKAFCSTEDRKLLLGLPGKIGEYTGYIDGTSTYSMQYYTSNADLGAPATSKFLKKASLVVIGSGDQDFVFKYGYDYTINYSSQAIIKNLGLANFAKYNTNAEYGIDEYASVGIGVNTISVPLGGSGKVIQFGVEATVEQDPVSIQKIDVFLKTGKNS